MINGLSTEAKILGAILVVTAVVLIGGIFFLSKSKPTSNNSSQSDQPVTIDYTKGQKIGSDSAKMKLVEFSDFQCPSCAAFEPAVKEILAAKYDNFQYIYRYFPLTLVHKNAMAASIFGQFAADKGKFWEVHDKLFDTQTQWENLKDPADFFAGIAKEVGLNDNEARSALSNQSYRDIVQADVNEGNTIGVNSTPTFILNNRKLDLKSYQSLKSAVEAEFKK